MKKVFVSSTINGFEKYREAARSAIGIMDFKPLMAEIDFGARSYSSEVACITEAESCDIFLLILGKNYGFEVDGGLSVTHAEFKAARAAGRKILVFIQTDIIDANQLKFKAEVEEYYDGYFRTTFENPVQLKDEVLKGLRQLEKESQAKDEQEFVSRFQKALKETSCHSKDESRCVVAFWQQPERAIDLDSIEASLDDFFFKLCSIGAMEMKTGYKNRSFANRIEIESGKTKYVIFEDGMRILYFSAESDLKNVTTFSFYYQSPKKFHSLASKSVELCDAKLAWALVGLLGMESKYFAEHKSGSNSTSVPMFQQSTEIVTKFFSPLTPGSFQEWLEVQTKRFKRMYGYPD